MKKRSGKKVVDQDGKTRSLDGTWKVTCHGLTVMFNLFGDRKVIAGNEGHNVVLGRPWGHFTIVRLSDGDIGLNYDDPRNPAWMRKVLDRIRPADGGYTGDFFYAGHKIFRFSLTPILSHS